MRCNGNYLLLAAYLIVLLCNSCKKQTSNDLLPQETGIVLNQSNLSLYINETYRLMVSYASGRECTSPIWKSSNTEIAVVSETGVVCAKSAGSAQIEAIVGEFKTTCEVLVELDSLLISEKELVLFEGQDTILSIRRKSGKYCNVTWTSSNENVVTISSIGKLKAISTGEATISAVEGEDIEICSVVVKATNGFANEHEWVDLGLSMRWATMNVGAMSNTDYGDLFSWGEVSSKGWYDWSTYRWYDKNYKTGTFPWTAINKYTIDDGWHGRWYRKDTIKEVVEGIETTKYEYTFIGDGKTRLNKEDDAATVNWGGDWRMPTKEECQELIENCNWVYGSYQGVVGVKIIGPNNQSIFIPAAGHIDPDGKINEGVSCSFWSCDLLVTPDAWYIYCSSGKREVGYYHRRDGRSIRPVYPK